MITIIITLSLSPLYPYAVGLDPRLADLSDKKLIQPTVKIYGNIRPV